MNGERERLSGEANCLRVSDLELVRKARNGDGDAFHELVDRYAGEFFDPVAGEHNAVRLAGKERND